MNTLINKYHVCFKKQITINQIINLFFSLTDTCSLIHTNTFSFSYSYARTHRHALSVFHSHIVIYTGTYKHTLAQSLTHIHSVSHSLYNSFLHAHTQSFTLSHKCTLHLSYSFIHAHTQFLSLSFTHTSTHAHKLEKKEHREKVTTDQTCECVWSREKCVKDKIRTHNTLYSCCYSGIYVLATIPPITSLGD